MPDTPADLLTPVLHDEVAPDKDISDGERLLEERCLALEDAFAGLRELARQINNPLQGATLALNALNMDTFPAAEKIEMAQIAQEQVERVAKLVSKMLTLQHDQF